MKKDSTSFVGSRLEFAQKLILLRGEEWSIHGLAGRFGISRNTVRNILRTHADQRDHGHDILTRKLKRASKLDSFEPGVKETLKHFPDITGQRLHEKLQESGYTFSPVFPTTVFTKGSSSTPLPTSS